MTGPVKLAIAGCCGRMGTRIASLAVADGAFALVGALESPGHAMAGKPFGAHVGRAELAVRVLSDAREAFAPAEVIVDFTTPAATREHVQAAHALKKGMVIGTTGLTEAQLDELRAASKTIPVVFSPNMSLGVNVLYEVARTALARLGSGFDVEIVEAHHRQKKDSPSGTAKRLAQLLAAARGVPAESLPVHAVRAGDIVGDHTVILAGPSERLELTHRAHSRDVFAQGALAAARFVRGRRPGLYDMSDVLKGADG